VNSLAVNAAGAQGSAVRGSATRSLRPALAASLLGLLGFVVLTALVLAHPGPLPLDRELHRLAVEHRAPILGFAAFWTRLGTMPVILPLLVIAGVVAARRTGVVWFVVLGPVLLFAGQAVRLTAMVIVDRPRPPRSDWVHLASGQSFPSGHTTTSALGYSLMLLLLAPSVHAAGRRALLAVGLLTVAGLVGVSRVVLGVHWPTDVLGGWSLALFLVPLAALALRALEQRAPGPRPARPGDGPPAATAAV
jgi:undecaprenyl-diphosphatase